MPLSSWRLALTPPSFVVFAISLTLAVQRHAGALSGICPCPSSVHRAVFDVLAIAYVVLTIGVLLRGV